MSVAGIVLAAGRASRMGRSKVLLGVGPHTVLGSAVRAALGGGLSPVAVVLGHDAGRVRAEAGLPEDPRVAVVVNEAWAEGQASSLRAGLLACASADAVAVMLGDNAGLTAAGVAAVVEGWAGKAPLVVPLREGRVTHPVLFARELWPELLALSGDVGAREVVLRHWDEAVTVEGEALWDLDAPGDYARLQAGEPPPPSGFEPPR